MTKLLRLCNNVSTWGWLLCYELSLFQLDKLTFTSAAPVKQLLENMRKTGSEAKQSCRSLDCHSRKHLQALLIETQPNEQLHFRWMTANCLKYEPVVATTFLYFTPAKLCYVFPIQ